MSACTEKFLYTVTPNPARTQLRVTLSSNNPRSTELGAIDVLISGQTAMEGVLNIYSLSYRCLESTANRLVYVINKPRIFPLSLFASVRCGLNIRFAALQKLIDNDTSYDASDEDNYAADSDEDDDWYAKQPAKRYRPGF